MHGPMMSHGYLSSSFAYQGNSILTPAGGTASASVSLHLALEETQLIQATAVCPVWGHQAF